MLLRPSTLRGRLTIWYAVLLCLPLVAFAVATYLVFTQTLRSRTDNFIGDALTAFSREVVAERRVATTPEAAIRTTVDEVRFRDLHIAVLDSTGTVVAMTAQAEGDGGADRGPSAAVKTMVIGGVRGQDIHRAAAMTLHAVDGPYRMVSRPLSVSGVPFLLTGSYSLLDVEAMLDRIRVLFLVAIPLLVLSAGTGASFLAKRGLAPVASMATQAATISASNLHQRLPVAGGRELTSLATVINDLLDRLEHAFEQQRRFVADASHELRTPTAILRAEADVTLSREHRTEEEYRGSVAIMLDAAGRLGRVVDDLFLLARADAGHLVMHPEPLYLEEVLHDAMRAVRSMASERGVTVVSGDFIEARFVGDRDLLGRLLLNLLDNAIKHSFPGGVVQASLDQHGETFGITVTDAGEGIPNELQARVFERFYRVDASRSRAENSSTSGAGLGLAIARRIAEMHAGELELVESHPGRTVFQISLPIGPSRPGTG